ncbi:MAG: hypothetical protein WCW68_09220, partial [Methanothrix sp.]
MVHEKEAPLLPQRGRIDNPFTIVPRIPSTQKSHDYTQMRKRRGLDNVLYLRVIFRYAEIL